MKEVLEEIIDLVDEASQFGKSRILLGYMDKIKTVAVEAKAAYTQGMVGINFNTNNEEGTNNE